MRPNREQSPINLKFQKILRICIAIGYILLAAFVVYNKWLMVQLSDVGAYSLGFLLLLYGGYRLYRSKDVS